MRQWLHLRYLHCTSLFNVNVTDKILHYLNGTLFDSFVGARYILNYPLNQISIGSWDGYRNCHTLASIEFYLKPLLESQIIGAMQKSSNMAFDPINCP